MLIASLVLAGKEWLPLVAGGVGVGFLLLAFSYARSPGSAGLRLGCAALKLLGFAALLACLLEPMWTTQRPKPGANLFAVVADNSRSMGLRGQGESSSRGEQVRRILAEESLSWRASLAENFEVRNYLADTRLTATQDFKELTFEGRSSSIGAAARQVIDRYRGQPLAGILMLTDGIAGDLADVSNFPQGVPIYPVIIGSNEAARDLAINNTGVTQTSFEDAPVTVQADVIATRFGGEEVIARLYPIDPTKPDETGKPVVEETIKVPANSDKVIFRLQVRPDKLGVLFYRLVVTPKENGGAAEATTANNETIITIDRSAGPYRILYVTGRPNWEYKFLQRAILADDQTQLVGLIRIAKREPKFEFRGRAGESSNPLFRGFGNQSKEEIERYDQPVLVRLGTEDEQELRGGFPKTPETLYRYHALIVDDLEADFFSADQMSLVQRFVSERGGGFLMLSGAESFGDGGFARTPIGDMLPVYLDTRTLDAPAPLRLQLTREGLLQPWARLRSNEPDENKRLSEQPYVEVINRVGTPKPAAIVVATATDGQHQYPALVAQRFGRGRSAAMLIGDLWHTGLGDEALQKDLGRTWRQLARWLVSDVPSRVEVHAQPQLDGQTMAIRVRANDEKFQPLDNALVSVKVHRIGLEEPITLTAEPSAVEPGLYEAEFIPRESAGYRAEVSVADENGALAGTAQTGWSTNLDASEFRSLTPNRALMEALAAHTGGRVLDPSDLPKFVRELPSQRAPVMEISTHPLWHTPWMFAFALACFLSEWGLRRWKGLA